MTDFLVGAGASKGAAVSPPATGGRYDVGRPASVPTVDAGATPSTASGAATVGLLPIIDGGYGPDSRYSVLDVPIRPGGGKYPVGTVGIILAASKEKAQENLFFPTQTAFSMVAVNAAGDPSMASIVSDLTKESEIDPTRTARLQSAWWVVKGSKPEENTLAWQLGKSGRGDVYGGMVIDSPSGSGPMGSKVLACVSVNQGGFLDVGSASDKHFLFADADGHRVNRAHIGTGALFRLDNVMDGPLAFEAVEAPTVVCGPNNIPVHLGWDAKLNAWRWWAESAFQIVPPPPWIPTETPTPKPPKPPDEPTIPSEPPWVGGGSPAQPPPIYLPPYADDEDPNWKYPDLPTDPHFFDLGGSSPADGAVGFQGAVDEILAVAGGGTPSASSAPGHQTTDRPSPVASTHLEISSPSIAGQPVATGDGIPDIKSNPTPGAEALAAYAYGCPVTVHMEAFGAQNALDSFLRTEQPGIGRWPSGSGPGGWQVLCPQASLLLQDPASINRPVSPTLFVAGPNVSFGSGTVDRTTGAMHDGWSWGEDAGALTFTDYSIGVGSDEFKLTPAGDVAFQAGTGDWGTLTHAITGSQTWTFPDQTGTVALTSDIPAPSAWYGGVALVEPGGGNTIATAPTTEAFYTYTLTATGDQTIDMDGAIPHGSLGQVIKFLVQSDAAAARTITFGAWLAPTGTLVTPAVAGSVVAIDFASDGVSQWVENSRQTAGV